MKPRERSRASAAWAWAGVGADGGRWVCCMATSWGDERGWVMGGVRRRRLPRRMIVRAGRAGLRPAAWAASFASGSDGPVRQDHAPMVPGPGALPARARRAVGRPSRPHAPGPWLSPPRRRRTRRRRSPGRRPARRPPPARACSAGAGKSPCSRSRRSRSLLSGPFSVRSWTAPDPSSLCQRKAHPPRVVSSGKTWYTSSLRPLRTNTDTRPSAATCHDISGTCSRGRKGSRSGLTGRAFAGKVLIATPARLGLPGPGCDQHRRPALFASGAHRPDKDMVHQGG